MKEPGFLALPSEMITGTSFFEAMVPPIDMFPQIIEIQFLDLLQSWEPYKVLPSSPDQ